MGLLPLTARSKGVRVPAERRAHRILLASLAFALGCEEKKKAEPPPPEVQVITVTPRDVPLYREWVGTIDADVNVDIRARVQGVIQSQQYIEGSFVKAGQVLFSLEPDTLKASTTEASGAVAKAREAVNYAHHEVERYKLLVAGGAASQMELDRAIASEASARAQMETYGGSLKKTKIDLSYAQVISPIDGIAGIADVRVGNLVGKNEPTLLTTVSSINPIRVTFPITEKEYLNAPEVLRDPEKIGKPNEGYLDLVLANGKVYPPKGRLFITNRQFDPKTGSITLQALFPNPDMTLRPGQYARVRAAVQVVKDALLVPQRAVQELQGIAQIAVVGPDDKIDIRKVKLGERTGSFWLVTEGLKPGERVVAEGLQKVRAGMTVQTKPFDASGLREPNGANDLPEALVARPETPPVDGGKPGP
jgi:membrane fusion protein, multidrug efflux system